MNSPLYSYLYLNLKNVHILKRCSLFANLLMKKPGYCFAMANMQ